jgi:RNA polymerase sigma factor (sigma-70 family)
MTSEEWEKLLACFSLDREEAARLYENARQKLIRYFEWNSSIPAEDYADDAMDRAGRRLNEGQKIDKPVAYLFGIARNIVDEARRERARAPVALDEEHLRVQTPEPIEPDERRLCFNRCLEELAGDNRDLLLDYFEGEGGAKIRSRQGIANRLGIPLNALRIRVHRIRKMLEDCIAKCLEASLVRND